MNIIFRRNADRWAAFLLGQSYWVIAKEILFVASHRRRLFLAVTLFVFHKLTGTDSLNYFAPQIFAMVGVPRGSGSLLTTGVYGLVKVFTTLAYVTVIVDRVGRRLPLIVGALIQGTAMLYLALFIRFARPEEGGGTSAGGVVGVVWYAVPITSIIITITPFTGKLFSDMCACV